MYYNPKQNEREIYYRYYLTSIKKRFKTRGIWLNQPEAKRNYEDIKCLFAANTARLIPLRSTPVVNA